MAKRQKSIGLGERSDAFQRAATNALTLGGMDKVDAFLETLFQKGEEGESFRQELTRRIAEREDLTKQEAKDFPVITALGDLTGFMAGPGKLFDVGAKALTQGARATTIAAADVSQPLGQIVQKLNPFTTKMEALQPTLATNVVSGAGVGAGLGAIETAIGGGDISEGATSGAYSGGIPLVTNAIGSAAKKIGTLSDLFASIIKNNTKPVQSKIVQGIIGRNPELISKVASYGGIGMLLHSLGAPLGTVAGSGVVAASMDRLAKRKQDLVSKIIPSNAFKDFLKKDQELLNKLKTNKNNPVQFDEITNESYEKFIPLFLKTTEGQKFNLAPMDAFLLGVGESMKAAMRDTLVRDVPTYKLNDYNEFFNQMDDGKNSEWQIEPQAQTEPTTQPNSEWQLDSTPQQQTDSEWQIDK